MASVQAYFNEIAGIFDKRVKGNAYERFCLEYLKRLPGIAGGWLLRDVPQVHLRNLGLLNRRDNGIDGILWTEDDLYIPFQSKFRTDNARMTLTNSDVATALLAFRRLIRQRPDLVSEPIVISNFYEVSSGSELLQEDWVRWILLGEQLGVIGESALSEIRGTPVPVQPKVLRPYQVEDLTALFVHYRNVRDAGQKMRALFHAFTGYGKTVCIAEWCRLMHLLTEEGPCTIVIVAPLLKIVGQTINQLQEYYASRKAQYRPMIINSSSDGQDGVLSRLPDQPGVCRIIVTTYKSYPNLCSLITPRMVIFDEVHRFRGSLHPDVHYIGFTATPTRDIYVQFSQIVHRSLNWGILNRHLVDYNISAFIWDGDLDQTADKNQLYVAMIIKLLTEHHTQRLLVVCSRSEDAWVIARLLQERGVNSESVTARDDEASRQHKEENIRQNGGVLTSVKIYREGADLIWLDGLFLTVGNLSELSAIQVLGRILRLCLEFAKMRATVFFPVLAGNQYTDHHHQSFKTLTDFMYTIALMDPDVFQNGVSGRSNRFSRLRLLFRGTRGRPRQNGEPEVPPETVVEDLIHRLTVRVYNRANWVLTTGLSIKWYQMTIATILRVIHSGEPFPVGKIKGYGDALLLYMGMTGLTPDQTMSRVITEQLTQEDENGVVRNPHGFLKRIRTGTYIILDREGMWEEIGREIPENFPIRLVLTLMQ
jgi:superfamily II DNA or RNA helicase